MTEKKFASDTQRNRTWANRRKLGGYMVAIAAFIATVEAVSRIAADPEHIGPECPCTADSAHSERPVDMRGRLTQRGEG